MDTGYLRQRVNLSSEVPRNAWKKTWRSCGRSVWTLGGIKCSISQRACQRFFLTQSLRECDLPLAAQSYIVYHITTVKLQTTNCEPGAHSLDWCDRRKVCQISFQLLLWRVFQILSAASLADGHVKYIFGKSSIWCVRGYLYPRPRVSTSHCVRLVNHFIQERPTEPKDIEGDWEYLRILIIFASCWQNEKWSILAHWYKFDID